MQCTTSTLPKLYTKCGVLQSYYSRITVTLHKLYFDAYHICLSQITILQWRGDWINCLQGLFWRGPNCWEGRFTVSITNHNWRHWSMHSTTVTVSWAWPGVNTGRSWSEYEGSLPQTWERSTWSRRFQETPEKNRPDLVVIHRSIEKAIIMVVTIPFKGEEKSCQATRAIKEIKYSTLKSWLLMKYKEVKVATFVIGAWASRTLTMNAPSGCWELKGTTPGSFDACTTLYILAIEGSRKIWQTFRTGDCL